MRRTRARKLELAADSSASQSVPPGATSTAFRPLSADAVGQIIDAAYEVLGRTGVQVDAGPIRDVFLNAGCPLDTETERVRIPAALIDRMRKVACKEVLLAGLEAKHDLNIGGARVYLGTGGSAVNILDLEGRVRETTLRDNYDIGRLCDRLDNIHFYMRPVVPRDLETADIGVNSFYACLAGTTKHVMANEYRADQVWKIRALGDLIAGGVEAFARRPILSFALSFTVSPLRFAMESVEILDEVIAHGLPVALSSAPQAGATSPAALAGTLAQILAEQFSGMVYVNLKNPGHPTLIGCVPSQADLRSGAFTGGSAEFALMNAAIAQIAQHLELPLYNSAGISDSKLPDAQAGYEKGMTTTAVALSGANYVHHSAGFLESLMTVAFEQYPIDNDINGAVMRLVRGIEVTPETLSLAVIDTVCRGEGHFLAQPQTLKLMNSEYFYPPLADRRNRDDWQDAGAQDQRERARSAAREILESHYPQTIPPEVDREIRRQFDIFLPEAAMRPGAFGTEV
ncbi:trimethylamine methyltransferase family protein [Sulfitobacter sp. TSTF-M16]|uniref:Trimethylamine methyltransferase family protein n=1 Tax=Sulfitobacter aestuariivivens TaxID=2766981 RepID=A0A927D668_9RHOB|nr:trimethylamine methyltransferase family protein [Sulfitobacter aestuariivivens]MBD3665750.1 trimethylamine methyltransferase family protein [Sulfitobacter aestuariivivens]